MNTDLKTQLEFKFKTHLERWKWLYPLMKLLFKKYDYNYEVIAKSPELTEYYKSFDEVVRNFYEATMDTPIFTLRKVITTWEDSDAQIAYGASLSECVESLIAICEEWYAHTNSHINT